MFKLCINKKKTYFAPIFSSLQSLSNGSTVYKYKYRTYSCQIISTGGHCEMANSHLRPLSRESIALTTQPQLLIYHTSIHNIHHSFH